LPSLPDIPGLSTFRYASVHSLHLVRNAIQRPEQEIRERLLAGDVVYITYAITTPAAFGWVTQAIAAIGELGLNFEVPEDHCYLWDFVTRPDYRGRGLYPHLLQTIMRDVSASN